MNTSTSTRLDAIANRQRTARIRDIAIAAMVAVVTVFGATSVGAAGNAADLTVAAPVAAPVYAATMDCAADLAPTC